MRAYAVDVASTVSGALAVVAPTTGNRAGTDESIGTGHRAVEHEGRRASRRLRPDRNFRAARPGSSLRRDRGTA